MCVRERGGGEKERERERKEGQGALVGGQAVLSFLAAWVENLGGPRLVSS